MALLTEEQMKNPAIIRRIFDEARDAVRGYRWEWTKVAGRGWSVTKQNINPFEGCYAIYSTRDVRDGAQVFSDPDGKTCWVAGTQVHLGPGDRTDSPARREATRAAMENAKNADRRPAGG